MQAWEEHRCNKFAILSAHRTQSRYFEIDSGEVLNIVIAATECEINAGSHCRQGMLRSLPNTMLTRLRFGLLEDCLQVFW